MLAVACTHLSIKDSQFNLKGNCTLLLLHKEQERKLSRGYKTGLRQVSSRRAETLSVV